MQSDTRFTRTCKPACIAGRADSCSNFLAAPTKAPHHIQLIIILNVTSAQIDTLRQPGSSPMLKGAATVIN